MRGIILAAGRGSRLKKYTTNIPKCKIKFKNKQLINWQIEAFKKSNIDKISLVKGYLGHKIKNKLHYFYNNEWNKTNMVFSLFCADEWLNKYQCIITYSDIVYSYKTVNLLKKSKYDISITYDPNWLSQWKQRFDNPLSDAETLKLNNNIILEIGKKANSLKDIEGQYMGLIKIKPSGWITIKKISQKISKFKFAKLDMTSLLQILIENKVKIEAIPIKENWIEIDNVKDLSVLKNFKFKN